MGPQSLILAFMSVYVHLSSLSPSLTICEMGGTIAIYLTVFLHWEMIGKKTQLGYTGNTVKHRGFKTSSIQQKLYIPTHSS